MPKITETQRETRRQQILDAALRCFSRDGFHATTTADIVRESGISQGALYLYFATKDDIILALADDRHQGEALINALAESEQDPIEGLNLLLELYGRSLSDPQRIDGRRVGIQGWAEALRSPAIRDNITGNLAAIRAEIARIVGRGQQAGLIRAEVAPDALARILIASFQGLILQVGWGEDIDLPSIGRVLHGMLRGALFTDAALAAHPDR
jgi:AcrR family transcriptional regulator